MSEPEVGAVHHQGSASLSLTSTKSVSRQVAAEIAALAAEAATADGVSPLDDQVRSELAYGAGPTAQHILGHQAGTSEVVAYGHFVADDEGASAHLVVHPERRRHGHGSALVKHLSRLLTHQETQGTTLRVWAHGDTAGAQRLASATGFERVRDLWQMSRPLALALPEPTYPEDVVVRTFEPDQDESAWIALNAAAFADHPEQGRLTVDDLQHRMGEPWFDPAGFFLAERGGKLVGSHWTKVHPTEETGGAPVGEVYAVGVHPDAQGLGLGKALTLTGLRHLQGRGLAEVMLYVDGDNAAATSLYQRLDFTTTTIDAMYAASFKWTIYAPLTG